MDLTIGCGCGVIEPDSNNEKRAYSIKGDAENLRKQIAAMERVAERYDEMARRLMGGGVDCEDCEGLGGWQTPPGPESYGESGWETCPTCEGYHITRALTCADHEEMDLD